MCRYIADADPAALVDALDEAISALRQADPHALHREVARMYSWDDVAHRVEQVCSPISHLAICDTSRTDTQIRLFAHANRVSPCFCLAECGTRRRCTRGRTRRTTLGWGACAACTAAEPSPARSSAVSPPCTTCIGGGSRRGCRRRTSTRRQTTSPWNPTAYRPRVRRAPRHNGDDDDVVMMSFSVGLSRRRAVVQRTSWGRACAK